MNDGISLQVKGKWNTDKILKNMRFGAARGLTQTAKDAQAASVGAIQTKFRNRKTWFSASSPIGIRIKPATPQNLVATVYTAARFMPLQDEGGIKLPFNHTHLAIPAKGGPLANVSRIPENLRPRALVASGKAWIETTEKGTKLLVTHGLTNKGRYRGNILWYILVPKATIKRADVFDKPVETVVKGRLLTNLQSSINAALADIR